MKSGTAGALSGCIVWLLVFGFISACLVPIGLMLGGLTSTLPFAVRPWHRWSAPKDPPARSTATIRPCRTTTASRSPPPATSCTGLDASGNVVKNDPVAYSFIWEGIAALIAALATALLAFVLAAPAGILIGRLFKPHPAAAP